MIITILCIVLLIIGIMLDAKVCNIYLECLDAILIICSGTVLFTCIILILIEQIGKDVDYQNKLYEREVLEYRIENMDDNIVGNEMLYNDIVEFNNSLRSTKKWANNPWTNWFNNRDIATIKYIEIEK